MHVWYAHDGSWWQWTRSIRHAAVNQTSIDAVPWLQLPYKVSTVILTFALTVRVEMTVYLLTYLLWRSRITTRTKLRLYNAYILPIILYGSKCWTVNIADVLRIDALGQWCLWQILNIRWHDFVRNDDTRRMTEQPPLSSIVKRRCLSLVWTYSSYGWGGGC